MSCIHKDTCYILYSALLNAMKNIAEIDRTIGKNVSADIFRNCIEIIAKNCRYYIHKPYSSGVVETNSKDIAIVSIVSSNSDVATDALRDLILGRESGFIHINIPKELITNKKSRYYTLKSINTMICILQELVGAKFYALIELEARNRVPVFIVIDEKIDDAYLVVADDTAKLANELADIEFKTYNYPEGNPSISKKFDYNSIVDVYNKVVDIIKTYGVK